MFLGGKTRIFPPAEPFFFCVLDEMLTEVP